MADTLRERIHPELLAWYDASPGFDFEHLETFVPQANAAELAALREDPDVHVYDKIIPGPAGNPDLKIRIYEPAGRKELLPACLFFHGGGFLFGTVYRQERMCQGYVKNVGCIMVSVEYRLAPKWKYPAPIEDSYAALEWVYRHGKEIGADSSRLALCGLSAGGTITAAVAMLARDRKGPPLRLQMPLYAELDYRMEYPSCREITSYKVWCYANNRTSWDRYLNPEKEVDYIASPGLCQDLAGLPPLFSYIGQLDPGRDENIDFWSRMMQAGVDVEYHVFPGCYHCFELGSPNAAYSKNAYELSYAALRRAFR